MVVKIGGGLLRARGLAGLRAACDDVADRSAQGPVLVVPGGGPFADAVRTVDRDGELGDPLAHRLALAAMDQLGTVLSELLPGAEPIADLRAPAGLGLLRAASAFAGRPDVPESWAVTSDSLAVLAAGAIGADQAILLKPVDGVFETWPKSGPPLTAVTAGQLRALQRAGQGRAVDPYLPDAIEQTGVTVVVRAPPRGEPRRSAPGAPAARPVRRRPPARGSRLTDGAVRSSATAAATSSASNDAPRSPPRQTAERTPTMSASTRPSWPARSWPATPKLPPAARVRTTRAPTAASGSDPYSPRPSLTSVSISAPAIPVRATSSGSSAGSNAGGSAVAPSA